MDPRGLHLFLGPDRARKLQRVQEFQRTLGVGVMDRHDLDGAAVGRHELIALCRQRPALSPVRLIVIDQAHQLESEAGQMLVEQAEGIAQTACVVLLADWEMSVRHPLARAAHEGVIDVMRFAGREGPTVKPFALLDAIGSRDTIAALQALWGDLG